MLLGVEELRTGLLLKGSASLGQRDLISISALWTVPFTNSRIRGKLFHLSGVPMVIGYVYLRG